MGLLEGKVALVTGAGTGIGRADALLFAQHGAKVVVNDPGVERDGTGQSDAADRVVQEIRAAGGEAVAVKTPVGTFEAAEEIVGAAVKAFGGVDILVNNAGILRDRTALKLAPEEWNAVLGVHLTGSFACLQAAARVMKDQGRGGRIINMTSIAGLRGNFGQSNYSAAKAGIYGLTRTAALELARFQITVNAVCPTAYTRMTADNAGVTEAVGLRFGPETVAPLVVYLATDQAAHLTGRVIAIEGTHVFAYHMTTTVGIKRFVGDEPWKVEELAAQIDGALAL
jgi:NAD(P)-dependent dehydrogenase (short-subunit alcohol dehydrogenase family)